MKSLRNIMMFLLCLGYAMSMQAQNDRQNIRIGNKFYRQGDFAKAEIEYRKALAQNGSNPQAIYDLGCALLMQQKDSAAIVQFEQAGKLEKAPMRKAMVYHNIGVICQTRRMYGDAIKAYEESLRNNPNDNQTRYNLALCKRLNKDQKNKSDNKDNKKDNGKGKGKDKKQGDQDKNKNQKGDKQNNQQQSQPQMSKQNAEQLLNYAVQAEKATQQRLQQQKQQAPHGRLPQNW